MSSRHFCNITVLILSPQAVSRKSANTDHTDGTTDAEVNPLDGVLADKLTCFAIPYHALMPSHDKCGDSILNSPM